MPKARTAWRSSATAGRRSSTASPATSRQRPAPDPKITRPENTAGRARRPAAPHQDGRCSGGDTALVQSVLPDFKLLVLGRTGQRAQRAVAAGDHLVDLVDRK